MDTKTIEPFHINFGQNLHVLWAASNKNRPEFLIRFRLLSNTTITAQVISSNCIKDKVKYGLRFWDNFSGCGFELDKTACLIYMFHTFPDNVLQSWMWCRLKASLWCGHGTAHCAGETSVRFTLWNCRSDR